MSGHSNLASTAANLTEDSLLEAMRSVRASFHMERCRLVVDPPTVAYIATPPSRWHHHESFMCEGLRFDVWINWDGRARIEHDGEIILAMWAPAGDILRDIEARRQARQ